MEWYLSGDDAAGVRVIRRQIADYLVRHARPGTDVSDAELVVQELLANAVEHADGPIWVSVTWSQERPDLEVWDLGPGFTLAPPSEPGSDDERPDLLAEGGRGLYLVRRLADGLTVHPRSERGSRVVARLPVRRATALSIDLPPPPGPALPDLTETGADGTFGRDAFLGALVVQLAAAMEHAIGPDAGERVVAQVGAAVGRQMEAAYRHSRALTGRLSPEQLADCLTRLKAAVGGGFHILEITEDAIVLGNTRCPFGDAVRRAPALCRLTSSVFGGIAARNHPDGASVLLEERIAVGDPGCRVVVRLGTAPADVAPFAHHYHPTPVPRS